MNTKKYTDEERKERKRQATARYYARVKDDPEFKKKRSTNRKKWETENPEKYKEGMKIANANRKK